MKNTNNKLLKISREKIDILLSFGASEELDISLDKLITFQIAKYNSNINQIRYELQRFETKYQMASEEFFSKFEAGMLGDDADYFEWVGLYENVLLYKQRIKSLLKFPIFFIGVDQRKCWHATLICNNIK